MDCARIWYSNYNDTYFALPYKRTPSPIIVKVPLRKNNKKEVPNSHIGDQ